MKKKIAIFGGTFDPIHFGHINLAIQLKELFKFDVVLFCPAYCSPFKEANPPSIAALDRLIMVDQAIRDIEGFKALDLEIKRKGVSYTIDTIRELIKKYGHDVNFFLLMSKKTGKSFFQWKGSKEIIKISTPIVGGSWKGEKKEFISLGFKEKFLVDTMQMDISSTYVRNRLKKKLYCNHLLPLNLVDFINKNGLY